MSSTGKAVQCAVEAFSFAWLSMTQNGPCGSGKRARRVTLCVTGRAELKQGAQE